MHLEMSNSVYHHTAALLYCLAIAYIILLQLGYTLNLGNNLCSSWDELLRWLGCQGTSCLVRISLPLGAVCQRMYVKLQLLATCGKVFQVSAQSTLSADCPP